MNEKQIAEIEAKLMFPPVDILLHRYATALIHEVRRLRAVVAEYANRDNWTGFIDGPDSLWIPDEDGYTRAENALAKDGE